MTRYSWPGNVRELLNVIERALSFAEGSVIQVADLPEQLQRPAEPGSASVGSGPVASEAPFKEAKERWVSSFEREYLLKLLARNSGNISHAAREADIDRKYFRKLMRRHGVSTEMFTDSAEE
jgi:DNA-binding NtrC family response regulator